MKPERACSEFISERALGIEPVFNELAGRISLGL